MTNQPRTMRTAGQGAGTDCTVLWLCGHQSRGGEYKRSPGLRPIPMRCVDCAAKAKAAKAAAA